MPRAAVSIFLALVSASPTVATESCLNGQCHDETSLMQVKTSVIANRTDPELSPLDLDNAISKEEMESFAGRTKRTLFTRRNADGTTFWQGEDCLVKSKIDGHGGWPACKTADKPGDLPCAACIADQWADGSAAGFACCDDMRQHDTASLKRQPLCGICLRAAGNALDGPKGVGTDLSPFGQDQSRFATCATHYCALADKSGTAITDAMLDSLATACSPKATGNTGAAPVANMVAMVANNPRKGELEEFLDTNKGAVKAKTETITGTASSSKMAVCVTEATKAGFTTESGPWGGDAQLAGLIAAQCTAAGKKAGNPAYLKAVVFMADPNEAHHLDIMALKNLMERCTNGAQPFPIAFEPDQAKTLLDKL